MIKIPKVEERVNTAAPNAATPRAAGPVREAQGFDLAQMPQQIAHAADNINRALVDAQAQYDALKVRRFQQSLQAEEVKYGTRLGNINNPEDFANAAEDYRKSIDTLGRQSLGDRLFSQWNTTDGDGYFKRMSIITDNAKFETIKTQNRINRQALIDDYATKASLAATPQDRSRFDALAVKTIEGGLVSLEGRPDYKPEEAEKLKREYFRSVSLADVERDVNTVPETAMQKLRNDKEYPELKPVERQKFIEAAQRELKSRAGTTAEGKTSALTGEFLARWEANPNEANLWYQQILAQRVEAAGKYGLTPEQLRTATNFMQDIIDNPNQPFATQAAIETDKLKQKFQLFAGTAEHEGAEPYLEGAVEFIDAAVNTMNRGYLSGAQLRDVGLNIARTRELVAEMAQKPKLRDTSPEGIFRTYSASEYLADEIRKVSRDADFNEFAGEGGLTNEDLGGIYIDAYRIALANKIDTNGYYKNYQQQISDIINAAKINFITLKYPGIPKDQISGAIVNGRILKLKEEARQ